MTVEDPKPISQADLVTPTELQDILSARTHMIPIEHGTVTSNFEVQLDAGKKLHAKAIRIPGWPSLHKLATLPTYIHDPETDFPRIQAIPDAGPRFPLGLVLSEWVEGESVKTKLENGTLSTEEGLRLTGEALRRLHKNVKPNTFTDLVTSDSPVFNKYGDYLKHIINTRLRLLGDTLDPKISGNVFLISEELIRDLGDEFSDSSSVVHRDAARGNVIVKPDGKPVLIDWDNAEIGSWITDVGRVVSLGHTEEERETRRRILLEALGKTEVDPEKYSIAEKLELIRNYLERILHKGGPEKTTEERIASMASFLGIAN